MRVSSGVFGLDEILNGGFIQNTVNAVFGSIGCGKTIFCLNFILEGLDRGEKCAYISFDLDLEDFLRIANSMHWDLSKEVEEENLKVEHFYAEESTIVNEELFKIVEKFQRVVIDSFSPLVVQMDSRARSEINWFFKNMRKKSTSLITIEEPLFGYDLSSNLLLYLVDCVISLRSTGYSEPFGRTLRVMKHRMSSHLEGIYPYSVVEGVGIVVEGRKGVGFEVEDLDIPNKTMEKLKRLCREGYLTKEDIEKIKKRLRCSKK
ncbi:MAG: ATPase domain-containing protein [Archaeoglobaceae archaeon]|nr:ATPase domain-containing protein [Archaeoglobaceae archaeon]